MAKVHINHSEYQARVRTLPDASLRYIIQDAKEAIKANPDGPKAGYYADEINYAASELARRQKISRSQ
jgi:hypothetical protein